MYYSLFAGAGNVGRYSVFTVHDHGEGLTIVGLLKWWLAAYQHEQDHTKTPDICDRRGKNHRNDVRCQANAITAYVIKQYAAVSDFYTGLTEPV